MRPGEILWGIGPIAPIAGKYVCLTRKMVRTFHWELHGAGSIATLIVVQRAAVAGVTTGFCDYFEVGAPPTVITLALGTLWLWL